MNNAESIEFCTFAPKEEIEEQRKLFRECFPENNGTSIESKEHYNWKFHSIPNIPNSYEFVAKLNGNIIGYYAALPFEYIIKGERYTVGMVCDVMTGIKARGKGIFVNLGAYSTNILKQKNLAFTTGYPIRPEVMPGHMKVGWKREFQLPLYMSFIKTNGVLRKAKLQWLSFIPNMVLFLLNRLVFSSSIQLPYQYDVYTPTEINKISGLPQFIKEWSSNRTIVLNKSNEFLKWRLSAPEKSYEIIAVRKNKLLIGLAIVAVVVQENIKSLAILDFMVLDDSKKVAKLLNSKIIEVAQKSKAEIILNMKSKYESKKLGFASMGYIQSPYKFTLIIKQFYEFDDKDILHNEENWSLSWIDSDVF